jgi:hypothetical protein
LIVEYLSFVVIVTVKGAVPKEWRTTSVVPIFKKGDKSNAANYRPVSLTAICSKLQEHILCSTPFSEMCMFGIDGILLSPRLGRDVVSSSVYADLN